MIIAAVSLNIVDREHFRSGIQRAEEIGKDYLSVFVSHCAVHW